MIMFGVFKIIFYTSNIELEPIVICRTLLTLTIVTKKVPVPDRKLLQKLQNSNPFQHDCLIRHINMCKINCQVRKPKVWKLISSALYLGGLGRTSQFFHIISGKRTNFAVMFLDEHLFCFGAELINSLLTINSAKTTELKKRF